MHHMTIVIHFIFINFPPPPFERQQYSSSLDPREVSSPFYAPCASSSGRPVREEGVAAAAALPGRGGGRARARQRLPRVGQLPLPLGGRARTADSAVGPLGGSTGACDTSFGRRCGASLRATPLRCGRRTGRAQGTAGREGCMLS